MTSNIFEQLSGGRFIDLGSRLTAEEIAQMGRRPFRRCPECEGECIVGMAIAMTSEGMLVIPMPCPLCGGEGEVPYVTDN